MKNEMENLRQHLAFYGGWWIIALTVTLIVINL